MIKLGKSLKRMPSFFVCHLFFSKLRTIIWREYAAQLQEQKEIAKLADILGHGSIETTRIYMMTTGVEHRRKIEQLGLVI